MPTPASACHTPGDDCRRSGSRPACLGALLKQRVWHDSDQGFCWAWGIGCGYDLDQPFSRIFPGHLTHAGLACPPQVELVAAVDFSRHGAFMLCMPVLRLPIWIHQGRGHKVWWWWLPPALQPLLVEQLL